MPELKNPRLVRLALLVVLLSGAGSSWWSASRADRDMRSDAMERAHDLGHALNKVRLDELSGSSADLKLPGYQRLKQQLIVARASVPDCRFIYLMGRRPDGAVYFFVDSEEDSSKDYSPPGQIYDEVPDAFRQAFNSKAEAVVGPVTDRWGTWVTGLVPLVDPKTGAVIAVLGMDSDARTWRRALLQATVPPIVLSLVLSAILVLGSMLLARRARSSGILPRWQRRLEPILAAFVGIAVTLFAAWMTDQREQRHAHEAFTQIATARASSLAASLREVPDDELEGLASFIEAGGHSTAADLARYSRHLTGNSTVRAWEWAPMVTAPERAQFEATARAEGLRDFSIWQRDSLGGRTPAASRDTLFPVLFVQPLAGNERAFGYDLGSEPRRRAAIDEARRSGLPSASAPISLVQGSTASDGIIVFRPVFAPDGQRLRGFAVAVLQMNAVLANADPDLTTPMTLQLLRRNEGPEQFASSGDVEAATVAGWSQSRLLLVFGRVFSVTVYAGRSVQRMYIRWAGELVLLAGLLLTAALVIAINALLARRDELEQQVAARTQALHESERNFRRLFDTIDDLIFVATPEGRVLFSNGPASQALEYAPDELAGMSLLDLRPVDRRTEAEAAFAQLLAGERTTCTMPLVTKTGSQVPADSRFWFGTWNGAPCIFCVSKNLTADQEAQRRFESLFRNNPAMMALAELPERHLADVNDACLRTLGYAREEMLGKTAIEAGLLVDPERALHLTSRLLAGERVTDVELQLRRKDGSLLDGVFSGEIISSHGTRYLLMVVIDVTERRRVEQALRELNRDLDAARVKAVEMAAQAESASVAKSTFLATMSHEIRTPMNGVLGMTHLLAETNLNVEQRRYTDAIERSAHLLMSVINDILDFSKVEAGKLTIESAPFDLELAVADVAELLMPRAVEKNVELVVDVASDVPRRLVGDGGRLRQVLLNLAGNAMKFTERGFVLITVRGARRDDGVALRFEIKDTGVGISASAISRLFTPFTQADASTSRRFGGTGLGLSICRRLMELMGGQIGVESVEGEGSTFWFAVTLTEDQSAPSEPLAPVSLDGVRALVVDDVSVSTQAMAAILASRGMRVDSVSTGADALETLRGAVLRGDPYRVAVIDSRMPGLDGEGVGRAVRGDAAFADLSLVLVTSTAERGDAARVQAAGFSAYLTKPLRAGVLVGAVEAVGARGFGWCAEDVLITRHVLEEQRALARAAATVTQAAEAVREPSGAMRVLLAEDNPVNQMVAVKMLERLGCTVDVANDGAEAVSKASAGVYDLIFMDMQMPRVDGLEATRRIRQLPMPAGSTRIVAMTANAMSGDRVQCLEAGMDDFVSKPVMPAALEAVLAAAPKTAQVF